MLGGHLIKTLAITECGNNWTLMGKDGEGNVLFKAGKEFSFIAAAWEYADAMTQAFRLCNHAVPEIRVFGEDGIEVTYEEDFLEDIGQD